MIWRLLDNFIFIIMLLFSSFQKIKLIYVVATCSDFQPTNQAWRSKFKAPCPWLRVDNRGSTSLHLQFHFFSWWAKLCSFCSTGWDVTPAHNLSLSSISVMYLCMQVVGIMHLNIDKDQLVFALNDVNIPWLSFKPWLVKL